MQNMQPKPNSKAEEKNSLPVDLSKNNGSQSLVQRMIRRFPTLSSIFNLEPDSTPVEQPKPRGRSIWDLLSNNRRPTIVYKGRSSSIDANALEAARASNLLPPSGMKRNSSAASLSDESVDNSDSKVELGAEPSRVTGENSDNESQAGEEKSQLGENSDTGSQAGEEQSQLGEYSDNESQRGAELSRVHPSISIASKSESQKTVIQLLETPKSQKGRQNSFSHISEVRSINPLASRPEGQKESKDKVEQLKDYVQEEYLREKFAAIDSQPDAQSPRRNTYSSSRLTQPETPGSNSKRNSISGTIDPNAFFKPPSDAFFRTPGKHDEQKASKDPATQFRTFVEEHAGKRRNLAIAIKKIDRRKAKQKEITKYRAEKKEIDKLARENQDKDVKRAFEVYSALKAHNKVPTIQFKNEKLLNILGTKLTPNVRTSLCMFMFEKVPDNVNTNEKIFDKYITVLADRLIVVVVNLNVYLDYLEKDGLGLQKISNHRGGHGGLHALFGIGGDVEGRFNNDVIDFIKLNKGKISKKISNKVTTEPAGSKDDEQNILLQIAEAVKADEPDKARDLCINYLANNNILAKIEPAEIVDPVIEMVEAYIDIMLPYLQEKMSLPFFDQPPQAEPVPVAAPKPRP